MWLLGVLQISIKLMFNAKFGRFHFVSRIFFENNSLISGVRVGQEWCDFCKVRIHMFNFLTMFYLIFEKLELNLLLIMCF